MQIAACSAAAKSVAAWALAADRLTQSVADELVRRVDGETDSAEVAAHLTKAITAHLHELSLVPRAAADNFDARFVRVPIDH